MRNGLEGSAYGRELVRRLKGLSKPAFEPDESLSPAEKVAASKASVAIGAALHDSRLEFDAKREALVVLERASHQTVVDAFIKKIENTDGYATGRKTKLREDGSKLSEYKKKCRK